MNHFRFSNECCILKSECHFKNGHSYHVSFNLINNIRSPIFLVNSFLLNCQYFIHFLLFNFQEAQNQDPAYLQGWIGQALLAETASYEDEAIDLFRHCTFLGMTIWVAKFPWDGFLTQNQHTQRNLSRGYLKIR